MSAEEILELRTRIIPRFIESGAISFKPVVQVKQPRRVWPGGMPQISKWLRARIATRRSRFSMNSWPDSPFPPEKLGKALSQLARLKVIKIAIPGGHYKPAVYTRM